ncbi:hypothetical protein [Acidovorax sp. SUPP2539]|uniref:hypothetical protein n=1 Tax=Acidovorax sp. SUPP2539 TaxID=2920878 RepID=UPI0023DE4F86|nr:hypothetical protein [Acidovorax sp. SUPP2539]GKS90698.1 hypothetical protein AVTE2539_15055 [Acidovorax sp. SUPP2539]
MSDDINSTIDNLLINGASLPDNIFVSNFEKYLFFDADIGSSDFIDSLRQVVVACFDEVDSMDVFSSSTLGFIDRIKCDDELKDEIFRINRININNDDGGLIVKDANGRWIAYQRYPADIGVFAINSSKNLSDISGLSDSFFDCSKISNWLQGKSSHDVDIVKNFGANFLSMLIKNYQ